MDRTNVAATRDWSFLQECRRWIPAKASLTVLEENPAEENDLYMFALGVFPDNPVWPSWYLGFPSPDGSRAEYVLVPRGAARPVGLETVSELADGAVCRRRR